MQNNSKLLFLAAALLSLTTLVQAEDWHSLSIEKTYGISGLAAIDKEHFLAVHDSKKNDQPRLSILEWKHDQKPSLTTLNWCGEKFLPIDIEAITAIPGATNEYLLLESDGKVSRLALTPVKPEDQNKKDKDGCQVGQYAPKITVQFNLPQARDIEGLALYCEKQCVLAWGERGKNEKPGILSWANFDIQTNQLSCSQYNRFEFKAPFPKAEDARSISDITIDAKGKVWVSAVSDTGDKGPFQSAIYQIASFKKSGNSFKLSTVQKPNPAATYEQDNVKIEALLFTDDGLILGTDDEDLGAKIRINSQK